MAIGTPIALRHARKETVEWQFNGPVQTIKYSPQYRPIFTIDGKEYNAFHMIWNVGTKIHIGDTLIKYKGDNRLILIRRNSKDTIYFNR
jgi:hypothetical protein